MVEASGQEAIKPPIVVEGAPVVSLMIPLKAFCADPSDDIFDRRGIDRTRGALIVVRPDQYVAQVLPLDAMAELEVFFKGILRLA